MMRKPTVKQRINCPDSRCSTQRRPGITGYVRLGLFFCCLFFTPITVLRAEETALAQARQAMENREYAQAYASLNALFRTDPGNAEINFLLGRAAFENKDYEAAVMAFERVLILTPDAERVKLELARCLYQLGSLETARQYFEEVLAANPPANVRENIQRYLKIIQAKTREHYFSGRLSVGLDFNDNANVAPTSGQIDIMVALGYIIPVSVDRPVKDQIYNATMNFNYVYKPVQSPLAWKVSGVNYNAVYRDVEHLDINLFELKAGISQQDQQFNWEGFLLAGKLDLDYRGYQESLGAGVGCSTVLNPKVLLSLQARYRKKDYPHAGQRDAHNFSLSAAPVWASGPHRLSLNLGWELENAKDDTSTYNRENAIFTYERMLPYGLGGALAYWYQRTDYKEANPFFDAKRKDDVQYFIASLSKDIWRSPSGETAVQASAGYTYTRSDSNIELYAYTQNVISTSLSWVF